MGLAFIPIYIKYLGIEAFGLIGLFAIMQAWMALLDFGMTPTINREMARYKAGSHSAKSIKDLLRSLETICVVVGVLVILCIWLVSDWLASNWLRVEKLPVEHVATAISVIGLVVALRFWEGLYRGAIIGLQKQVWLNVILSISATLRWAGAAIVVMIEPEVNMYFLWHGAVSILTITVFVIAIYRWLPKTAEPPSFSADAIRNVWLFARGMLLTTLLALVLTQIDKVLLSKLISLENFGYYTLAATIAAVAYQVVIPITQAYYPKMTEQVTRTEFSNLAATYHQASQLVTVFLVSISAVMVAFSYMLLELWTANPQVAENTAPIMSILVLGTMFNGLMYMPYMLQLAHGWPEFAVKVNAVAIVFLVPAILWATPNYGPIGAAWCWLVLNIGYFTIAIYFMHKRIMNNEKWLWYIEDLAYPSVAIGIVVVASYFAYPYSMPPHFQIIWITTTLALCLAAGILFSSKISVKNLIQAISLSVRKKN